MTSNYKRLGDFITQVNIRNTDGKITDLRGLSLVKDFRKSTSNTVGADMTKYKVMQQWQFSANFMGLGVLVDKAAIVLKTDEPPNIVSSAYPVFEVIDHNLLNPEYLMMWFRRSEFDRYCVFKSDKGIRGGFDWNDLCEVELPVPPIEKQNEIVKEYNTIVSRIKLNEKLNERLEYTAQALYKHWFVDFEFPNENGQPYKSSGGEMVYNEELDQEIPISWFSATLEDVSEVKTGPFGSALLQEQYILGGTPVITVEHIKDFKISRLNYPSVAENDRERLASYSLEEGDIVFSRVGSVDLSAIVRKEHNGWLFSSRMLRVRPNKKKVDPLLLSYFLKLPKTRKFIQSISVGSTMPSINTQILKSIPFYHCPKAEGAKLTKLLSVFSEQSSVYQRQNYVLEEVKALILSKMSKVESPKTEKVL